MDQDEPICRREMLSFTGTALGLGALLGLGGAGPVMAASTPEDSAGVRLIKEYYATYARLQPELLRKFFADDIQ